VTQQNKVRTPKINLPSTCSDKDHHDVVLVPTAPPPSVAARLASFDHIKKLHLYRWSTSSRSLSLRPLSYPGPTGLEQRKNVLPLLGPGLFTRNSFAGSPCTLQSGGGMGVKSVDQDAAPILPFSLPWLDEEVLFSAGKRMSDVIVGIEDGISSLSQRSMISGDGHRPDDGAFVGAAVGVEVVGLAKKEESFVCPTSSFFCFAVPEVEVSVRGRLRDSRGSCDGLREAWLAAGDTAAGDGGVEISASGWLEADGGCEASDVGGSSTVSGGSCVSNAPKAVARVESPFGGAVGGGDVSATRLVKKLDMSVCFP